MDRPGRRKILFITGTRADYGKLRPLIESAGQNPQFECHIFATGMHTLARYGSTYDEIRKAGFENLFLFINQHAGSSSAADLVLANTVSGLAHYVREFRPDLMVVHGDRVEALSGAIVGALNNILVAHVEGGELSGTVDELMRHAITKLSHLHFVAHDEARQRVIQMGEVSGSVHVTGSADIDVMLSGKLPGLDDAKQRYEIPFDRYSIFLFHPVTTELEVLGGQIREVVSAVMDSHRNFVVIYPNSDPGSDIILETLRPLNEHPRFRVFPSIRFEYFLTLLRHAEVMVGNSSAGMREAPVYGVPTVNIGTRQLNRFDYPSILHVRPSRQDILDALENLPHDISPTNHFGNGDSAQRFAELLNNPELWATPRQKQFRDIPRRSPVTPTRRETAQSLALAHCEAH